MYIPQHFEETDRARLHALMQAHDFAMLATASGGAPFATHVPVLLDATRGEHGTLFGHMARANPQWRAFDGGTEALVVFHGPHCYISPTWYETRPSVPTWNYAAVHAYGAPRVIEDEAAIRDVLRRTAALYEGEGEGAWTLDGLPETYVKGMIRGIVAFEIPIARLEGKFKLSQNRAEVDRRRVVAALEQRADPLGSAVAALMRERENGDAAAD